MQCISTLLHFRSDVLVMNDDGRSPASMLFSLMCECVAQGRSSDCHRLISAGVPVNGALDQGGNSLLHIAAYKGFEEITTILVSGGANLDARNETGI